jgi:hypothetical protein
VAFLVFHHEVSYESVAIFGNQLQLPDEPSTMQKVQFIQFVSKASPGETLHAPNQAILFF